MKKIIFLAFVSLLPLSSECFSMEKNIDNEDNKSGKKRRKSDSQLYSYDHINHIDNILPTDTHPKKKMKYTKGTTFYILSTSNRVSNKEEKTNDNLGYTGNILLTETSPRKNMKLTRGNNFLFPSTSDRFSNKEEKIQVELIKNDDEHPQLRDKRNLYPEAYDYDASNVQAKSRGSQNISTPTIQAFSPEELQNLNHDIRKKLGKPISHNTNTLKTLKKVQNNNNNGYNDINKLNTSSKECVLKNEGVFKVPELPQRVREEKKAASKAQTSTK